MNFESTYIVYIKYYECYSVAISRDICDELPEAAKNNL